MSPPQQHGPEAFSPVPAPHRCPARRKPLHKCWGGGHCRRSPTQWGGNRQPSDHSQAAETRTPVCPPAPPQQPGQPGSAPSARGARRPLSSARGEPRGLAGRREHGGAACGPRLAAAGPGRSVPQRGGAGLAVGRRPPAPRPGTGDPPASQAVGGGPRGTSLRETGCGRPRAVEPRGPGRGGGLRRRGRE